MNKKLITYLTTVYVFGLLLLLFSFYNVSDIKLSNIVFWLFLASICESLSVFYYKERTYSVTFAILLAVQLSHGTYLATIIAALSNIFILHPKPDGTYQHLFNIPVYKTFFNLSNFTISIFVSGIVFTSFTTAYPTFIEMPNIIIAVVIYISIALMLNTLIFSMVETLLFSRMLLPTWFNGAVLAFPNFFAISPIGFFIYRLYHIPYGTIYVLLLSGPLLLARYSFKLYLDSKTQYYKTVKTLTAAIEAKDKYTEGHSRRVEYYAEKIARRMKLSAKKVDSIKVAALLHDIGKIGIEDSILRKPANLTSDEWLKIQEHPAIGAKILEDIPFPDKIKEFIKYHHEKYNGTGYPEHLKENEIPIEAYILAAADAYDAMTSDRPYRSAMTREVAITNIKKDRGTHFHPEVADIFLKILEEEEAEETQEKSLTISEGGIKSQSC